MNRTILLCLCLLQLTCCISFTIGQTQYTRCSLSAPQNGWLKPASGMVDAGNSILIYCNEGYTLVASGVLKPNRVRCTSMGLIPNRPSYHCKRNPPAPPACPKCVNPCAGKTCGNYPSAKCTTQACSCDPLFVSDHTYYTVEDCNVDLNFLACASCNPAPCHDGNTCPGVTGAKCKSRFCSCASMFFKDNKVVTKEECKPKPPKACPMCMPAPCESKTCPNYPGATCIIQDCSCQPLFVRDNVYYTERDCNIGPDEGQICAGCLPGKMPCGPQDTCSVEGAQCVSRHCRCNSLFVKDNKVVSKEACQAPPPTPKACPMCMPAPCEGKTCPNYPEATCIVQECSCEPLFLSDHTYYTVEDCNVDLNFLACASCNPAPCHDGNTCPGVTGAKCKSRFCSCASMFFKDNTVVTKEDCKPKPPKACPVCMPAPCAAKTCPNYPGATCIIQDCSCEPLFVLNNVYYTKRDCNIGPDEGQICAGCLPDKIPCGPQDSCSVEGAQCVSRHCRCNSLFIKDNKVLSEEACQAPPPTPKACPMCMPAPCEGKTCPNYPGATCIVQDCSCEPLFTRNNYYYTEDDCNAGPNDPQVCARCMAPLPCGDADTCPAVEGAQCKSRYCRCNSIFVKNGVEISKDKCKCPTCLVYSCAVEKCLLYPNAKCVSGPCGCSVSHYELLGSKITKDECNGCPNDGANCFADPCLTASCPMHTNAVCKPNYCDGNCGYDFFVDGMKVKCGTEKCPYVPKTLPCQDNCKNDFDCPLEQRCCGNGCNRMCMDGVPPPPTCPPSEPPRVCPYHPCQRTCRPNAQCQANNCGGCFADYYEFGVAIPHQECEAPLCRRSCPPSSCADYMCRGVPDRKCVVDTCNQCSPRFYDNNGFRISAYTCSLCPNGQPPYRPCGFDPCAGRTCPGVNGARCMADYCKGCNSYDFYDQNGKLVENDRCYQQTLPLCLNAYQFVSGFGPCGMDECNSDFDCFYTGGYCCSNGCSNVCQNL